MSDYVDFIPWLDEPVGIEEQPVILPIMKNDLFRSTIVSGSFIIKVEQSYKIFDITGREIHTLDPAPGIYFIQLDDKITQKVIKIK